MYKLYEWKAINFGFVILCPNCNFTHLHKTVESIGNYYPKSKKVVVIPNKCKDYSQISKLENIVKGGNTIYSMINQGMKSSYCDDWNIVLVAQGHIKNTRVDIKYSYFIDSDKDIIFPITASARRLNFIDADINGMFIRKKAFLDIGDFPDSEIVDDSKILWSSLAIEKGYKFKGIVGARIF